MYVIVFLSTSKMIMSDAAKSFLNPFSYIYNLNINPFINLMTSTNHDRIDGHSANIVNRSWSSRKAWLLNTTLVILFTLAFVFYPKKRGKKKRRMNRKIEPKVMPFCSIIAVFLCKTQIYDKNLFNKVFCEDGIHDASLIL